LPSHRLNLWGLSQNTLACFSLAKVSIWLTPLKNGDIWRNSGKIKKKMQGKLKKNSEKFTKFGEN